MKKEQQILARTAREADEQGNKSGTKTFKSLGKIFTTLLHAPKGWEKFFSTFFIYQKG